MVGLNTGGIPTAKGEPLETESDFFLVREGDSVGMTTGSHDVLH